MLYLDNAATTKLHPSVKVEMDYFLSTNYGNANSLYYEQAVEAKSAIQKARMQVSELIHSDSKDVIFTSSGTESNNMILKGLFFSQSSRKKIITTKIEHDSILKSIYFLENLGANIEYVEILKDGSIDYNSLEELIDEDTLLVSIMHVNNELGIIFDIEKIAELCHTKNVLFHSDCTQSVGKIEIDFNRIIGLNAITFSSHKIYGPKGCGALIADENIRNLLAPLIHGGEQEDGLRGGTHAVANIVGFGAACTLINNDFKKNIKQFEIQEDLLIERLRTVFGNRIVFNNLKYTRIHGIISIQVNGINNQVFLKLIAPIIAASSGSACSNSKPSHVLKELGFTSEEIAQTIRLSLSPYDMYNNFMEIT